MPRLFPANKREGEGFIVLMIYHERFPGNIHCKTDDISWPGHAWALPGYVPYPGYRVSMAHILATPWRGLTRICHRFCSDKARF